MKKTLILLVFCCFLSKINAQEYEGIAKGDKEITFNGMVISMSGFTMGNVFVSYGKYLSDKMLVGLAPGLSISDVTDFSCQLFFNYNFSSSKPTFPYVKASYYQQSFNTEGADFFDLGFIQAGVGYKSFFNAKVSWDTSLTYGLSTASFETGMLMLNTGISIKW
jgi:hypothetical protein